MRLNYLKTIRDRSSDLRRATPNDSTLPLTAADGHAIVRLIEDVVDELIDLLEQEDK